MLKKGLFLGIFLALWGLGLPVQAQEVELTIFIDEDSLTVLVPVESQVSLVGIGFEVTIEGQRFIYDLSQYEAFRALYFDRLPPSICLRLVRQTTRPQLPQDCPSERTITQQLADSDVFWYDDIANQSRTLVLVQVSNPLEYCFAGTPRCDVGYSPPNITPTPRPAATHTPLVVTPVVISNVLFEDDFSNNTWDWETANQTGLDSAIQNGRYIIDFYLEDFEYWVVAPGYYNYRSAPLLTTPYEFSFEISNAASDSGIFNVAILFDVHPNYDPYKRLYLESDGGWRLIEWSSDEGQRLLDNGRLLGSPVNILDGMTHRITLQVDTNGYTLYVDGTLQARIPNFGRIYGTVGFGIDRAAKSQDRVYGVFDNIVISALN